MRGVDESSGGAGDSPRDRGCYRCDRTVAPTRCFRVEVTPPDPLSETYTVAVRYCCEHCAAAMNLSAFSERVKARAGRP
ncbi:hypothetical protein [Halovivax limisalsi]|uniref:hypothetical protein n=1 Tax=Halovivax limisalsi TaxID=1453760 RepID=UPI001FFD0304|nr:hypothetical protein [Halovivax limisalsi]